MCGGVNPEPTIGLGSWAPAGQGTLQAPQEATSEVVISEGLQSGTEGPVLKAEVEGTSQQVTKGSQGHRAGLLSPDCT